MWYPASMGFWYLSGVSGAPSPATTPFKWDVRPDRLGGQRYFYIYIVRTFDQVLFSLAGLCILEQSKVLSSVRNIGNGYILVTAEISGLQIKTLSVVTIE